MGVKLGLTMRKGRRLRVFENRLFKKDIWFEKEAREAGELGITGKKKIHKEFWWRNLDTDHLDKPRRGLEDNIKKDLKEIGCKVEDWIKWLRTRTTSRLFCKR